MPNYRRPFVAGGTFFFTVVTAGRVPLFDDPLARRLLRDAIVTTGRERPFDLLAMVLLPEHLHAMWTLPDRDADFSRRWALIKGRFTHSFLEQRGIEAAVTASRNRRRGRGVWQARFYDHLIRDETDFANHLDYLHYNPVKHGHVQCPHEYEHSTFSKWVRRRTYEPSWACACGGNVRVPDFEWAHGHGME